MELAVGVTLPDQIPMVKLWGEHPIGMPLFLRINCKCSMCF